MLGVVLGGPWVPVAVVSGTTKPLLLRKGGQRGQECPLQEGLVAHPSEVVGKEPRAEPVLGKAASPSLTPGVPADQSQGGRLGDGWVASVN